jgi:predicted CopG family antitoxin
MLSIDSDVHTAFKKLCQDQEVSMSDVVEEMMKLVVNHVAGAEVFKPEKAAMTREEQEQQLKELFG